MAAGEIGHLLTRGPYTIRGYFKADEHNRQAFTRDGFYRTGDLVRMTEDGNIIVESINKDQINRGGENCTTEEVEQALNQHPQVMQSALVAMPDRMLGEKRLRIYTVAQGGSGPKPYPAEDAAAAACAKFGLATFKTPDHIEFIEDMPYTALGKIDKKELRRPLAKALN